MLLEVNQARVRLPQRAIEVARQKHGAHQLHVDAVVRSVQLECLLEAYQRRRDFAHAALAETAYVKQERTRSVYEVLVNQSNALLELVLLVQTKNLVIH